MNLKNKMDLYGRFKELAQEHIKIEDVGNFLYAIGSLNACLKIEQAFRGYEGYKTIGYLENLEKHYFVLEVQ